MKVNRKFVKLRKMKKAMCDWRTRINREGAHSVVAVRLGRGKGTIPLASLCLMGGDSPYGFQVCMGCKLSEIFVGVGIW